MSADWEESSHQCCTAVTAGCEKTQKFVFRSALEPNQFSFPHSQDPKQTSLAIVEQPKTSIGNDHFALRIFVTVN